VIGSIVALLVATIIGSLLFVKSSNFFPFLPAGLLPVGTAASLIFWSYLGYENVSNVAEEFENPKRDFHRSIILSAAIIGLLYIMVAFVTIGTLAYSAGGSDAVFCIWRYHS
jgi:amino acid efflux transporter